MLNSDLNNQNPAKSGAAATYSDPYDPEGTLVNSNWNNFSNWNAAGVAGFEQLCHLVHAPSVSTAATAGNYAPWPRYMLPTLVSAGPDSKWGLNNMFLTASYSGYYTSGVNPDMSIDPNNIADSNDNIYSYRLGLDSSGN